MGRRQVSEGLNSIAWALWGLLCFLPGGFAQPIWYQANLLVDIQIVCETSYMEITISEKWAKMVSFHDYRRGSLVALGKISPACGDVMVYDHVDQNTVIKASYQSCIIGWAEDGQPLAKLFMMGSPKLLELKCPPLKTEITYEAGEPTCEVPSGRRVACGSLGISDAACRSKGCCYTQDNAEMPCYYGNTGCSKTGRFVILLEKEMTKPPLDLTSVYLKGGLSTSCNPVNRSSDLIVFNFPVSACGAIKKVEGGNVIYETDVMATRQVLEGPKGKVTRDSLFRLTVRCRYNGSDDQQLEAMVYTLAPPLPATDKGDLQIELRIAKGSQYSSWYLDSDYPLVKFLRDPVFVEVRILGRTDPSLVLMLKRCWATPNQELHNNVSWSILEDGCPFAGDNYQTVLHKVTMSSGLQFPSHHKRFEVKTFVFMEESGAHPLSGEIYFHCSAVVCQPSAWESCMTACEPRRKRSIAHLTQQNHEVLVSSDPVIFLEPEPNPEEIPAGHLMRVEKGASIPGHNALSDTYSTLVIPAAVGMVLVCLAFCVLAALALQRKNGTTSSLELQ
nr:PREDICTED: zona pellucida sperm-binding protein 4-like isoform X1 [Latimeria chalumnae]|eukprot:XP_006005257.1 PREDICTED: zona pellucida sperm-binding protein 4-like isoform X1 [Latimeria chalumnae]